MFSRSLSVLLLAASVAGFDYFVTAKKGKGVCVSNEREWGAAHGKELVLIYDVENGVLPEEREEKWTDDWQLRHLEIRSAFTLHIELSHKIVTTDGSEHFKSILKQQNYPECLLQASEATLLFSKNEDWREGSSFRVHLNELNPETGHKTTWAELCTDLSTESEKCERLNVAEDETGGADTLFEGRRWTYLRLQWNRPNLTLSTRSPRGFQRVKWSTNYIGELEPEFLFARTTSTRAVFFVPLNTIVRPIEGQSENEMSRTFSVGPERNLCLEIDRKGWNGDLGRFELLDSSGQVVDQGHLVTDENWRTRLNFDLGQGDFKLRLIGVKDYIWNIGACAGEFKIWSPSNGCYVFEGQFAFSAQLNTTLFSTQLNPSLQVELTHEQMLKVCDALKVKRGDPPLRFNSKWGATFKTCPTP